LAIDDLELEPDLFGDAGPEVVAVLGRAAGLGGDQAGAGDTAVAHLVAADAERLHGATDGGVADAARPRDALAPADDAGECVAHAEAVAGGPRHQKPAIVGAEIERRVGRPPMRAVLAIVTHEPMGRPPAPSGPRHPVMARIEAAATAALVRHRNPSCRAE